MCLSEFKRFNIISEFGIGIRAKRIQETTKKAPPLFFFGQELRFLPICWLTPYKETPQPQEPIQLIDTFIWKEVEEGYLQNIYFLLHDHNPTITPNDHNHELLDLNAYVYEPVLQKKQSKLKKLKLSKNKKLHSPIAITKWDVHA